MNSVTALLLLISLLGHHSYVGEEISRPLLEPVLLPLIPQISLSRSEVNNLGTAISVLLHLGALFAVVSV